jgi:hypothetical protein
VIGRVTAFYWRGSDLVAASLASLADESGPWPGIRSLPSRPIRLIIADNANRFDSLTGGVVASWSEAVALPDASTIIVRTRGDPRRALRHELAHLALHDVVTAAPRWFDEGYAAWASGEWDRAEVLLVNWELARGQPPGFDELNRDLVGGVARARAAYALAASAVQMLAGIDADRGLEPIIAALGRTGDMDLALRQAHAVTLDQFEGLWHKELRRRYGWFSFLASVTIFWGALSLALVVAWYWRRRRDLERRAALEEGWELPPDDAGR